MILSAMVDPEAFLELLTPQRLRDGWVGVVLADDERIVARTANNTLFLGQPAAVSLRSALSRQPQGWFTGRLIEGTTVYTSYIESPNSGWIVALGVPAVEFEAIGRTTFSVLATGLFAAIVIALVFATMLGRRISRPMQEEMDRTGAQEMLMPILQPVELWEQSGRLENYRKARILWESTDRKGTTYALGPTHEEVITDYVGRTVNSYKQLPITLYQQQDKFRDEIRPRFGLMRGREFIMKDAYSFDADAAGLDISYQKMRDAYHRIFQRCGLEFIAVQADPGAIGGSGSEEFMVVAESGEDEILYSHEAGYAADIRPAGAKPGVHLDPVAHGESRIPGQADIGLDAEPGHHRIHRQRIALSRVQPEPPVARLDLLRFLAEPYRDTLLTIVADQPVREIGGIDLGADALVPHDHGDLAILHPQRGRDLGADESRAEHREAGASVRQTPHRAIVVEGPKVDHTLGRVRQSAGPAAGREQQGPVLVVGSTIVGGALGHGVERGDAPAQDQLGAGLLGVALDALGGVALPQALGERWAVVGRVVIGPHDADAALGVVFSDAVRGGIGRHAPTDDQIIVSSHAPSLPGSWRSGHRSASACSTPPGSA
jgi:hypothetical protein